MYTGTDRPPQKAKHHAPRHLSQSLGTARPMHILSTLHAQPWNALASHQRIPMTLPDPPMRPWRLRPDLLRPHHTSCPPNAATSPSPRQVAVIVSRVAGITPRGACSGQRHARPACVSDLVLTCTCYLYLCSVGMLFGHESQIIQRRPQCCLTCPALFGADIGTRGIELDV